MVEGEMKEVSETDLLEAMKAAHEAIKPQCKAQMELMEEVGKTVKREYCHEENDEMGQCHQHADDLWVGRRRITVFFIRLGYEWYGGSEHAELVGISDSYGGVSAGGQLSQLVYPNFLELL